MIAKVGQRIIEYVAQVFDLHVNVGTQCDTGDHDHVCVWVSRGEGAVCECICMCVCVCVVCV